MNPELPYLHVDSPLRRQVCRGLLEQGRHGRLRVMGELFIFDSRAQAIELAGDQPRALLFWIGDYGRALSAFREQAREAMARGELALAALSLFAMSCAECALGALDAADESAERAEAWYRTSRFQAVSLRTNALQRAKIRGEGVEEALSQLKQSGRGGGLPGSFLASKLSAFVAVHSAFLGREEAALRALELAVPAVEKGPGWSVNYALALAQAAETLWTLGTTRHLDTIERCVREKILAPDFRHWDTDARLSLARLSALSRRYEEAGHWFARAREVLDGQGARPLRAITDFDEAWMYLRRGARGDRQRARRLLDAAVAQFEAIGMPGWVRRAEALAHA